MGWVRGQVDAAGNAVGGEKREERGEKIEKTV